MLIIIITTTTRITIHSCIPYSLIKINLQSLLYYDTPYTVYMTKERRHRVVKYSESN